MTEALSTISRPRDTAELVGSIPVRTMEVQDLYDALTDGYGWTVIDPLAYAPVSKHVPPLLYTLREAVFGGMEHTGGAPGFAARMPISPGALDLYETIDAEISEAWAAVFPNQIPGIESPEQLLAQLVAATNPDRMVMITVATQRVDHRGTRHEHWWVERTATVFTVAALLKRWVRQIAEFFDPPRTADIEHPCLSCGEMWAWKTISGEDVPYKVFVFIRDTHGNSLEARCLSCGVSWGRDKFMWIAAQIGGDLEAEAA